MEPRICFSFSVNLKDQPAMRRSILSTVASLCDPVGLVAPFLLLGKMELQEMCKNGAGWDDPLSDRPKPQWEQWKRLAYNVVILHGDLERLSKQNFHFSDASLNGSGQCTYMRLINEAKHVCCILVMVKVTTQPRLEPTAAVDSVAVSRMLREELDCAFWTDSMVLLGCINNQAYNYNVQTQNKTNDT